MRASVGRPRLTRRLGVTSALAAAVALLSACSTGSTEVTAGTATTAVASSSTPGSDSTDGSADAESPSSAGGEESATSAAPSRSASAGAADNGVASLTAREIETRAGSTMKKLKTVRVKGTMRDSDDSYQIDAHISRGGRCTLHMSAGDDSVQVRVIGRTNYIKATSGFYADMGLTATERQGLAGHWAKYVESPGTDTDDTLFGSMCSLEDLVEYDYDDSDYDGTKGRVTTVNGTRAVPVTTTNDDGKATGWVATAGEPYLIRLEQTGDDGGAINFSQFDEPFEVSAPPASEVVDGSVLDEIGASDT